MSIRNSGPLEEERRDSAKGWSRSPWLDEPALEANGILETSAHQALKSTTGKSTNPSFNTVSTGFTDVG